MHYLKVTFLDESNIVNGIEEFNEVEEITVSASESNLTLNNFSIVLEGM